MSVANPNGLILSCLLGRIDPGRLDYLTPEEAHALLVRMSGEDYGYDVRRWRDWMVATGLLRVGEYRVLDGREPT